MEGEKRGNKFMKNFKNTSDIKEIQKLNFPVLKDRCSW